MRRLPPVIECSWCHREFAPIRIDARFCCRECLDRYFAAERKRAVAAFRLKQRQQVGMVDGDGVRRRA